MVFSGYTDENQSDGKNINIKSLPCYCQNHRKNTSLGFADILKKWVNVQDVCNT
jgi:hypothetical protein